MRRVLTLAVVFTVACQPADEADPPIEKPVVSSESDGPANLPQPLPPGEYRLAGVGGNAVNLGHAITVRVTGNVIEVVSQCVTQRWTYRIVADRLNTRRIIEPVCDRGRYPEEEATAAVFDDPQQVMRTPENGLEVSGGGQSVTLFSQ